MSEFKQQFVKEAKENLLSAKNCLNKLQESKNNETLTDLKRSFHTLKGNSAAMGYNKFFELSKACNDLVQRVLDDEVKTNDPLLLLLSRSKDKLLYALDYIDNDKPEEFDDDGLIDEIKNFQVS
ncbi:MAG: Hpt domain-containing protein [Nanobdellota archaeon]